MEQRDDVGVVIDALLDILVHLDAGRLVLFDQGGCLVVIQLGIVQAGEPCAGLIVVGDPADDLGGIIVVVRPLEHAGLHGQSLGVGVQGRAFHLLDGDIEAGGGEGSLHQDGDLLIDLVACGDGQGEVDAVGIAGVREHLLRGFGLVGDHFEVGVVILLMRLGQHGGDGLAELAVDDLSHLRLVQAVVQRSAHRGVIEGLHGGVQQQVADLGGGVDFQLQALGVADHVHQGGGNVAHDVDLAGLQLHQAGVVIGDDLELHIGGLDGIGIAVVRVLLQKNVIAAVPLLQAVGAGAHGVLDVLVLGHGLCVGLAAQHHVEGAQLRQEGGGGALQGDHDLLVGGFDGVDDLSDEGVLGGFGIAGAIQAPHPVLAGHGRAVGEHQAGDQVEGVGQAVLADGPVGGQVGLDGDVVVAHLHESLVDLLADVDLDAADGGRVGLKVGGVAGDADDDGVARGGLGKAEAGHNQQSCQQGANQFLHQFGSPFISPV